VPSKIPHRYAASQYMVDQFSGQSGAKDPPPLHADWSMQDPGYGLRRIHLLGTWVNRGKEKGQGY
jgi:hypothetical protein